MTPTLWIQVLNTLDFSIQELKTGKHMDQPSNIINHLIMYKSIQATHLNLGDGNICQSSLPIKFYMKKIIKHQLLLIFISGIHSTHQLLETCNQSVQTLLHSFYSEVVGNIQTECVHNVTFILFISCWRHTGMFLLNNVTIFVE